MFKSVARNLGWWLTLIASTPLSAGTISVAWTPVSNATGYRVYYGQGSGQYTQSKDAGSATETTITGLQDCADYYVAVKAYNGGGESAGFSNEISGWSRPTVSVPAPASQEQGAQFALHVQGTNFRPGATVQIDNPNVHFGSATLVDCQHLDLNVAVEPQTHDVRAAEIGKFTVTVTNPDGTYAARPEAFEVRVNPARFDVNRSDDSTRGRLDGADTVWMARLFGSREVDPLYDPNFDLDGNGWVDGNDLAYLASNLGRCWSGTAWTIEACAGSHS